MALFFGFWLLIILRINLISLLISLELMLTFLALLFLFYGFLYDNLIIQMYVLSLLIVAASEAAVGLSLFIHYYRLNGTIDLDYLANLKG